MRFINTYTNLIGKPKAKTLLWWPRRRWEENITIDLRITECGCAEWAHLAQDTQQRQWTLGFH